MSNNYLLADIGLCLSMNGSRGPTYRLGGRDDAALLLVGSS
jgi:hypothetical protein